MNHYFLALAIAASTLPSHAAEPSLADDQSFNKYVLRAVEKINSTYPSKGYSKNSFYTHDLKYGDGTIKSNTPPMTMCVAAVAEVIAVAINMYVDETGDTKPYSHLPYSGWNRMRPMDIRSHIWVDHHLASAGTADALTTFGVGKRTAFRNLQPGSFINLNRTNKTGHAVVFMGFIDKDGTVIDPYNDSVKGFKYFSSQGQGNIGDAGFAYRYAFFEKNGVKFCPQIQTGKRDCGVIWSTGQTYLNTGYMLPPKKWNEDAKNSNLAKLKLGLYKQTKSKGVSFLGIDPRVSKEEFYNIINTKDTMILGEQYSREVPTTDD
jgi:hypothetical protein